MAEDISPWWKVPELYLLTRNRMQPASRLRTDAGRMAMCRKDVRAGSEGRAPALPATQKKAPHEYGAFG